MIGMSEQSPPQMVSFHKNSSQQTNQKTVFAQILLESWDCKSFVQYYFNTERDFERDKFTGKWFCKNVSEVWFQ
jgi:hypothetical protein